jgi:hypothetical protein
LHVGMGQIDQHSQPIAFLDDVCAEGGQAAIARRVGLDVAQRHGGVAIVE